MIVCKHCGHKDDDGAVFCGSCGAFLEWTGEAVPTDQVAAAESEEEAAQGDHSRGVVATVKAMVGIDPEADARAAQEGERRASAAAAERADAQRDEREQAEQSAREASEAAERERAWKAAAVEQRARAEREAEAAAAASTRAAAEAEFQRQDAEQHRFEARAAVDEEARTKAAGAAHAAEIAAAQASAAADAEERARVAAASDAEAHAAAEKRARDAEDAQRAAAEAAAARAATAAENEQAARAEAEERARRAAAMVVTPRPAGREGASSADPSALSPQASEARPAPHTPEAIKPGAPIPSRPPVHHQPPTRKILPGDRICGACGEGNAPDRMFCRRCGHSLAEAEVTKTSWWKRPFTRKPKVLAAGTRRPGGGGGRTERARHGAAHAIGSTVKVGAGLAAVVVVGAAVAPFNNPIRTFREKEQHKISTLLHPTYDPVRATGALATSEARPARYAIDLIKETSWASIPSPADGVGQVLGIGLEGPTDVDRIGFISGASEHPEDFAAYARPKKIEVDYGNGTVTDITLVDTANFQFFALHGRNVSHLALKIMSVYPGIGPKQVAITEVECFKKRK